MSPTPSPSLYSGYSNSMALQRYSLNRQVQNQTNSSNNVSYAASTSSGYVKKENPYYSVREQAQSSSASSQYSSPKTKTNDLINLDITDEATSFADILQTFDPLIARNEEASKSYYSDQDPFDYIYSGNSHCSGDPLYEAINRNERLATLREQGDTYYSSENEIAPPLPPRNSSIYSETSSNRYTSPNEANYPRKLYENIVEKTFFDKDSVAFYNMVKELRSKYSSGDYESNIGHVKAETNSSSAYFNISSIKILVYPSYKCFKNAQNQSSATLTRSNSENYPKLENYLPPVVFTCDIKSTVIHVIMQVLAMLENEIRDTPENFVLKTIGSQEWLSETDVMLSHLQYVQTSISLEKDVQFGLYPKHPKHLKAIARTEIDDNRDKELKIENILPKDPITAISYESLIILLETLEMEIEKLQTQSANSPSTHVSFNSSGVVQVRNIFFLIFLVIF